MALVVVMVVSRSRSNSSQGSDVMSPRMPVGSSLEFIVIGKSIENDFCHVEVIAPAKTFQTREVIVAGAGSPFVKNYSERDDQ